MSPEVMFAKALLAIEPPKIEGGSKERQDWLKLIIDIQVYLHEHGLDAHAFVQAINTNIAL